MRVRMALMFVGLSGCSLVAGLGSDYTTATRADASSSGDDAGSPPGDSSADAITTSSEGGSDGASSGGEGGAESSSSSSSSGGSSSGGEDTGLADDASGPPMDATTSSGGGSSSGGSSSGGATCGGTCIAAAPSGWTGPFQLYSGSTASAPTCPNGMTNMLEGNAGLTAASAECSACTCDDSGDDVQCEVSLLVSTSSTCDLSGGCYASGAATSNSCTMGDCASELIAYETGYPGALYPTPTAFWSGTPSTETQMLPPITWATTAVGCGETSPPTAGCSGGSVCVPTPEAPYQSGLCVSQSGDVSCPTAVFVSKSLYYTGTDDSRYCTPCGCASNDSAGCTGDVALYSETGCNSVVTTISTYGSACISTPLVQKDGILSWQMTNVIVSGNPVSTAQGGLPEGSVAAINPVTVCCTQ